MKKVSIDKKYNFKITILKSDNCINLDIKKKILNNEKDLTNISINDLLKRIEKEIKVKLLENNISLKSLILISKMNEKYLISNDNTLFKQNISFKIDYTMKNEQLLNIIYEILDIVELELNIFN